MTDSASSTIVATISVPCRNCGTPAPGNYCPECGQETSPHPPSVAEFVDHFLGNYVSVKSTLAQTVWALVSRPGQLTVDYLAGRKRRYVLPLKLYLTVSIVSLLLISLFGVSGGPPIQADRPLEGTLLNVGGAQLKYEGGKFFCTGLPERVCNHLRKRFDHSPDELNAIFADTPQRMLKFWGYAMFALIPFFALMLKVLYRNRGLVYGEHIVFALHLHTFWLLAVLVLVLLSDAAAANIGFVFVFAMPVYALLAMRRVYGGRLWARLLRLALMSLLYWLLMLVVILLIAALAVVL